jgi:prepilin-type N-terminal cleavage/methylation domain-containing protein
MLKKLFREESGFTLVELLVTIAIMGVLFGIVTLALNGLGNPGETNMKAAELDAVQAAIDIYLAENYPDTTTVTEQTDSGVVTATGGEFRDYLRSLPTEYSYTWSSDGDVTQQ